jgi:hypothetical protein
MGFAARFIGGLAAFGLAVGGIVLVVMDDSDSTRRELSNLHNQTVDKFSKLQDFGANRMPVQPRMSQESQDIQRTFQSELNQQSENIHQDGNEFLKTWESDGPTAGERWRWTVRKVQLVGLSKNDKPVVYLTDHLPKMDKGKEIKEIPTRDLDTFENHSLRLLRRGQELHSETAGNFIRMMAPIFAAEKCVSCHTAKGQMLGAFSYEIERVSLAKAKP